MADDGEKLQLHDDQKAQNLKYGNIFNTKTKIKIKQHVGYVLPTLVAKLETPRT